MEDFKNALSAMDNDWSNAKAPEINYEDLPDGKYQVNIETCRIEEKEGKFLLKWGFRILTGKFKRRLVFKTDNLNNTERFGYLKADLTKIGFELNKLSELPDLLPSLLDRVMEVTLKTGKPNQEGKTFQNCYIGKFVALFKDFTGDLDPGINLDGMLF